MNVTICEKHSGKIVGTYPVRSVKPNYVLSEQECIELAWGCVVEDQDVGADKRNEYEFILSDE